MRASVIDALGVSFWILWLSVPWITESWPNGEIWATALAVYVVMALVGYVSPEAPRSTRDRCKERHEAGVGRVKAILDGELLPRGSVCSSSDRESYSVPS